VFNVFKKFDIVEVVTDKRQEGKQLATILKLTTFEGQEAAVIQYHYNSCTAQQVCTKFMTIHNKSAPQQESRT
jgi:hypothetical protein